MNNHLTRQKGFCTFCMGSYDPRRIGSHIRRCFARKDDSECVQLNGRPHPMAFLLKAEIYGRPGAWICLEVHEQESFCNLDRLLRSIWFPTTKLQGNFFPKGKLLKK